MTLGEKLLKATECCFHTGIGDPDVLFSCENCPYLEDGGQCDEAFISDLRKLVKQAESRTMFCLNCGALVDVDDGK